MDTETQKVIEAFQLLTDCMFSNSQSFCQVKIPYTMGDGKVEELTYGVQLVSSEPRRKVMALPKVIGIWSPAPQSGKSLVASRLCSEYGYTLVSFAAPVKAMLKSLLECAGTSPSPAPRRIYGDLKETPIPQLGLNVTPRKLMQTLGTEWGRNAVYQNLWVDIAKANIEDILKQGGRVVLDDMRFPNEFFMVRYFPGCVLKVERPGTEDLSGHASEGALHHLEFSHTFSNSRGILELFEQVDAWVETYQQSNTPN